MYRILVTLIAMCLDYNFKYYKFFVKPMIRDVKPFDDKQWNQLLEEQKNGPTEIQLQKIKKIKERIKNSSPALLIS